MAQRKVIELMPITSQGVDLIGDTHRADLRDETGAHFRGHHVAERVRHYLAQVAPGGEHTGVGGRANGAAEVSALDPALEAENEGHAADDEGRAEDQDAGLPQRLPEEPEDSAGEHEHDDHCAANLAMLPARLDS